MWTGAPAPKKVGSIAPHRSAQAKEVLEGEQSPRKDRVFNIGNDVQHYGPFDGVTPGSRGNGKQATAAVTRYGCRGGEFFEGCDSRCGNSLASTLTMLAFVMPTFESGSVNDDLKRGEPHVRQ